MTVAYPAAAGCVQHGYRDTLFLELCFDEVRSMTGVLRGC